MRRSGQVGRKPSALLGALTLMIALAVAACSDDEAATSPTATTRAATTATPATTMVTTTTTTLNPTTTSTPEPTGVTIDNCGVETVYDAVPQRVVATDTSALEVLAALGLHDHVIGYFGGTPDRLQPRHQARAALVERLGGSFPYPSLEAVLAPGPDLVFSYGFNESAGLTPQNLRDAGVHSFSFTEACPDFSGNVTLEVMFEDVRAVAPIFEVEDRADKLIAGWEHSRSRRSQRRYRPAIMSVSSTSTRAKRPVHGTRRLCDVRHNQPRRAD